MKRILALSLALLLLVGAASAQARTACKPHRGERTVARSASATLILRGPRAGEYINAPGVLYGCSRRTGARRLMRRLPDDQVDDINVFKAFALHGTIAAYVFAHHERTDDWDMLYRDDTRRPAREKISAYPHRVNDIAVGPGGAVAYVLDGGSMALMLALPGVPCPRKVDEATRLESLPFDDRALSWLRDGARQSLAAPESAPSACAPAA